MLGKFVAGASHGRRRDMITQLVFFRAAWKLRLQGKLSCDYGRCR